MLLSLTVGSGLFAQSATDPGVSAAGSCPDINVSTAIDASGNSIGVGATDPFWTITASPVGPSVARQCPSWTSWEATPVGGTNAGWINPSGTIFNNPAGAAYVYERPFNVVAGTTSFATNFRVRGVWNLASLELVPPAGPSIPLTVPPSTPYYLGTPIVYGVASPMVGTWKIRATVNYDANIGAFLLSGIIDMTCGQSPCNCDNISPTFTATTNADCITTFVGSVNSACAGLNIKYDWQIDGSWAGSGQTFTYGFGGSGSHVVCLTVTFTMPDGTPCSKTWCKEISVNCDPCNCDMLLPHYIYTLDHCTGYFTADPTIPCCMKEGGIQWTVDGVPQGTGLNFTYTFPGNGSYNVCAWVTATLPNGTLCTKPYCQLVEVKDCDRCSCDKLKVNYTWEEKECEGIFTAHTDVPDCMSDLTYQWLVNGVPQPAFTGPTMNYTFPYNGPFVVCVYVTGTMPDGSKCTASDCHTIEIKNCTCTCDQINGSFDYFFERCYGHFTAHPEVPSCMQILDMQWIIDGTYYGSGPVFDYTFLGNGTHYICLRIVVQLPDGQVCQKDVGCQYVTVKDCDQCNCDQLQADFSIHVDRCTAYFDAWASGPECMQNYQYFWSIDGGGYSPMGPSFSQTFSGNGSHYVCMFVLVTLPDGSQCHSPVICKEFTITDCVQCNCEPIETDFILDLNQCHGWFTSRFGHMPPCTQGYTIDWTVDGNYIGSGTSIANYAFSGPGWHVVCMTVTVTLTDGTVCPPHQVCHEVYVEQCPCNCDEVTAAIKFEVQGCLIVAKAFPKIPPCMQPGISYTWTVNGAYAGSGQIMNYMVPTNGSYTVCVTITVLMPNGQKCSKTFCTKVKVIHCGGVVVGPSSIVPEGPTTEESLTLYPNPANDELNIDFNLPDAATVTVTFKTADGKEIFTDAKDLEGGEQHLKYPIPASVVNEMIFVEVMHGETVIVRKVSVLKR